MTKILYVQRQNVFRMRIRNKRGVTNNVTGQTWLKVKYEIFAL